MLFLIILLIFLFIFPFVIYPILLFFLQFIKKSNFKKEYIDDIEITILLAAYNEEELIEDCINSIINADYDFNKITFLIGSDGSTDKTDIIVKSYSEKFPNIKYFRFERLGKNLVLNHLAKNIKTKVVFYIDADVRISKIAIKELLSYYNDENVGLVISNMKQVDYNVFYKIEGVKEIDNLGKLGESLFQKYETIMKELAFKINSNINSLGQFYMMKMDYYENLPNDQVCDDYFTVLTVLIRNKKTVYNKDAIIYEVRKKTISDELIRRKRITAGALSAIQSRKEILNLKLGFVSFATWSQKVLRYFSPIFLVLIIIITYLFLENSNFKLILSSIIEFSLFLFLVSLIIDKLNINFKLLKLFKYFIIMEIGFLFGIYEFLKGKHNSKWGHNI